MVRAEDDVDAPIGLERPHVQVAPELADRVDPDLVAEQLEHVDVRVRAPEHAVALAEERGCEEGAARRLPKPAGPWKR